MQIGIDQIGLATPALYVDLVELAKDRGVDPNKFTIGIGQDQQAVPPASQDAVTLGASAAETILTPALKNEIGLLILGTESGVDASKAGALYIHQLLGLSPWCQAIEIKEACFGGTAGLMAAKNFVAAHPKQKALVIASDIARYGLKSSGEVTQGAGAVAMLVTADPRIMTIENDEVSRSEQIMDFWRPVYTDQAKAKGRYSTEQYLKFFDLVWARYQETSGRKLTDFEAMLFHLPYTKMGLKALRQAIADAAPEVQTHLLRRFEQSAIYSRRIGNIYTGSLYMSLLSLLENADDLKAGQRLGLFSYGSGAVAEFYSGILQPGFEKQVHPAKTKAMLDARRQLSVAEYERVFKAAVPYSDAEYYSDPKYFAGHFVLAGVKDQQRQYQKRD